MIISRIQYGLGNQLFQYALGKRLAIERKQELKLDTTWFDNNGIDPTVKIRNYSLGHFTINEQQASKAEINAFRYFDHDFITRIKIKWKKLFGKYPNVGYVLERGRHDGTSEYDESQLVQAEDMFLEGCWQSYGYFKSIEDELRSILRFNINLNDYNKENALKIHKSESVGIHIRKGDYLHPEFAYTHGHVCDVNYYQRAISEIESQLTNPTYFVFSDDFDWVRKSMDFHGKNTFYIDENDQGMAHTDMYLLSQCRHLILSNSTFSWWAAWFHNSKNNMIISPEKWSMEASGEHPGFPHWIKI